MNSTNGFNLIYARSLNEVIGIREGDKDKLPFHIPGDLPRFKRLTDGGVVVMGRNTWESFPKRPLPGRINIILSSRHANGDYDNTYFAASPGRVMEIVRQYNDKKIWLIGGAKVYHEFEGLVDTVYETVVMSNFVKGNVHYKFTGSTQLLYEDPRSSCVVDGETVEVINRVLKVNK